MCTSRDAYVMSGAEPEVDLWGEHDRRLLDWSPAWAQRGGLEGKKGGGGRTGETPRLKKRRRGEEGSGCADNDPCRGTEQGDEGGGFA